MARKNKSYAKDMMKKYSKKNSLFTTYDKKVWYISCIYTKISLYYKNISSFSLRT